MSTTLHTLPASPEVLVMLSVPKKFKITTKSPKSKKSKRQEGPHRMMVASNSIVNLERSHHRYLNPESDSCDRGMASYELPDVKNERGFDSPPHGFRPQESGFNPLNASYALSDSPAYRDVLAHLGDPDDVQNHSPAEHSPPSKRPVTDAEVVMLDSVGMNQSMSETNRCTSDDGEDSMHHLPYRSFPDNSNRRNSSNPMKSSINAMPPPLIDINGNPIPFSNTSAPVPKSTLSSPLSSTSSKTTTKSISPIKPPAPFPFDDDEDDSWKICAVCNDKATGYHFNALTCEGCKGFFRRSMKNGKTFTCPYSGNCTITKSNRRQCQACRLEKCLRIGMKKECIMSQNQIMMKKNLMLNNRIKRNILEWKPMEMTPEKKYLLDLLLNSHHETSKPPPVKPIDEITGIDCTQPAAPCLSPASSSSQSSGFSDLINRMTEDIVATAPNQSTSSDAQMRHFSEIMEFSIKEIIKFCKKIPSFTSISLKDQITLLKSGCTEILFIKANYTYDKKQNALMCGPGKYYTRQSFILGGMSEEYTDCYLKFHHDLSHMCLDDTEIACVCAAALFSSDRDILESRSVVENQQELIIGALQAYCENTHRCRLRFPRILAYLPRLRTLNWHISHTLKRLQDEKCTSVKPLIMEVTPTI